MAVSWSFLEILDRHGLLGRGRALLDIGTSNLYGADSASVTKLFREHGGAMTKERESFVEKLVEGSINTDGQNALNQSWLGQAIEAIGMEYDSLDIAIGYKTRVVDLNRETLPANMAARFDLVVQSGTTEQILNQYNAFRASQDATKPGGHIVHPVPATGPTDHGYYCDTSRFFLDLAGSNRYDVIDFWIDGPDGHDNMYAGPRSYAEVFPALKSLLAGIQPDSRSHSLDQMQIPNNSINVILKKMEDSPFVGMMEMSTSWGAEGARDVGRGVLHRYV